MSSSAGSSSLSVLIEEMLQKQLGLKEKEKALLAQNQQAGDALKQALKKLSESRSEAGAVSETRYRLQMQLSALETQLEEQMKELEKGAVEVARLRVESEAAEKNQESEHDRVTSTLKDLRDYGDAFGATSEQAVRESTERAKRLQEAASEFSDLHKREPSEQLDLNLRGMAEEIGRLEAENLALLGTLDEVHERNEIATEKVRQISLESRILENRNKAARLRQEKIISRMEQQQKDEKEDQDI